MKKQLGIEYLIESEINAINDTKNATVEGNQIHPEIIDLLLKIPYYWGELDPVDTPYGSFQSFCATNYHQAPYTFRILYDIYEKAYYLESLVLYRHLLESYIKMRYFHKYPERVLPHIINKNKSGKDGYVTFKNMFEEYSPGFYSEYYGDKLSDAAHGIILKGLFRFNRKENLTRMGCNFHQQHASSFLTFYIALEYGYLNMFAKYFTNNTLSENTQLYRNYNRLKDWLKNSLNMQKENEEGFVELYNHFDKLFLIN